MNRKTFISIILISIMLNACSASGTSTCAGYLRKGGWSSTS